MYYFHLWVASCLLTISFSTNHIVKSNFCLNWIDFLSNKKRKKDEQNSVLIFFLLLLIAAFKLATHVSRFPLCFFFFNKKTWNDAGYLCMCMCVCVAQKKNMWNFFVLLLLLFLFYSIVNNNNINSSKKQSFLYFSFLFFLFPNQIIQFFSTRPNRKYLSNQRLFNKWNKYIYYKN